MSFLFQDSYPFHQSYNLDIMFVLIVFYIWIIPSGVSRSHTSLVLVSHSHPIIPVKDVQILSFKAAPFDFTCFFFLIFVLPFEETGISFLSCLPLSSAYCGISFSLLFPVPFSGSWGHCLRLLFFYSISTVNFPVGITSRLNNVDALCFYFHSVWNTFSFPFWFILDLWII